MSATLYYRMTSVKNKYLKTVSSPSSFMKTLNKIYGCPPYRFSEVDIGILRGMSAGYGLNPECDQNGFDEIVEAIENDGEIEVWPEY
ncbi:MAG: hypothetical protein WAN65_13360 [Candidatus Sulfotelmatobacter sp.]